MNGYKEYTKTLCVSENDQMAYKLVVETYFWRFGFSCRSGVIDSDLEIAVFNGYLTSRPTMRIKMKLQKAEEPTTMKGPFTGSNGSRF